MDATIRTYPQHSGSRSQLEAYLVRGREAVLVDRHLLLGRYASTDLAIQDLKTHNGVGECYSANERPQVRMLASSIIRIPPDHIRFSDDAAYVPHKKTDEELYVRLSKHHALILYIPTKAPGLFVVDPASQNGIYVNSRKILPAPKILRATLEDALKHAHPLYAGDKVRLIMKRTLRDNQNHTIAPAATYEFEVAKKIKEHQAAITIPPGDRSVFAFKD